MKALYKMKFGPDCMEYVTDAPEPSPKADQIKVKVYGCCVCGTDIHLMHDEYACNPPVITGHEVSGTVVEVGADVTNFKAGDEIVTSTAIETCESCEWCKQGRRMLCANRKSLGSGANGGFAEYVVVPAKLAFHKPSSISLQTAALCEPFACCVRAVAERTEITAGDYVLVAGAGVMAQMCARIAKANGASVIMTGLEADATRFETARNESGVLATVRVDEGDPLAEIMRLTNGDGVSVAYECSGSAASTDFCIQALKKTGVYMQVAIPGKPIPINMDAVLYKEVEMRTSFASELTSWKIGLNLLEQGKVKLDDLASYILPLSEWEDGFNKTINKEAFKVVLRPNMD